MQANQILYNLLKLICLYISAVWKYFPMRHFFHIYWETCVNPIKKPGAHASICNSSHPANLFSLIVNSWEQPEIRKRTACGSLSFLLLTIEHKSSARASERSQFCWAGSHSRFCKPFLDLSSNIPEVDSILNIHRKHSHLQNIAFCLQGRVAERIAFTNSGKNHTLIQIDNQCQNNIINFI